MSRVLRSKWGLMIVGSAMVCLQLGQCVGDFLEDFFIFRAVD